VAASAARVANTLVANALAPDILAADVLAAERRASAAAQMLQSLLADPGLRALRNHFDPAYSALIAASHMSDFITPDRVLNPKALVDDAVTAVSSIANARAIAYYHETAGTPLPISPQ
jgi:5,10-methenyltetrahydromethanopterin hydrogenase